MGLGGVAFLGAAFLAVPGLGGVVLGGVAFVAAGFGAGFFGALPPLAFQLLPQPAQSSRRDGLVARHVPQIQSPDGRAGDGRFGAGREGAGDGVGAGVGFGRDGVGGGASGPLRVDPQMSQGVSPAPVLLPQSLHCHFAEPVTPVVPPA
ncbi:hypothetical protein [Streptomyces sp. NPDC056169]|uniref:hypothetical protein n=1 Tax=Streptomyces sp. NPDC056169 TaxID=3345734 RepID=UPI0035DE8D13